MPKTQRNEYVSLRRKFEPANVTLVIVAESPPASGNYFYNPAGAVSEHLFAAIMQQIGFTPTSKESGLREFQKSGWVLVDATYEMVNDLDDRDADRVIIRDYHLLRDDLAGMLPPDRTTPIILMKANVCQLLEPKLAEDGFTVLNHGRVVYFPSTGRQKDFQQQFGAILKSVRIDGGKPRGEKRSAKEIGNALLTTGKGMLVTGKDILATFINENREVILKTIVDAGATVIKRKYGVMITPDQHNVHGTITADEMADEADIDRKHFRRALRNQGFSWHTHGGSWEVEVGSPEHQSMLEVLATLT
jgi:hypothetical protein